MASPHFSTSHVYVYFIASGWQIVKIGISDDPRKRLASLQTAHYQDLKLLVTIECNGRNQALALESLFHTLFSEFKVRNEWFRISPAKVLNIVPIFNGIVGAQLHLSAADRRDMNKALEESK